MNGSDTLQMELFKSYPEWLIQFSIICCVILTLLGIPGNLITIIALASYQQYRNATAILIINLHICNLVFCSFILPLTVISHSEKRWAFGYTTCRVYALMKYTLTATAHFTVIAITLNRYIMVCHPFRYPSFNKKTVLITSLISTWIVGFCFVLPSFFEIWGRFDLNPLEGTCTMVPDKNKVYPKKFFVCFVFFGPYLIMSVCYGRIWWVLRKRRQNRNKYKAANGQITISVVESDCRHVPTGYVSQTPTVSGSNSEDYDVCKPNDSIIVSFEDQEQPITKSLKCSLPTAGKEKGSHLPTRKDRKLATMILALLISFTLCHLPLMLLRVVYGDYMLNSVANVSGHLLEYSSACISPVIYVFMSNEYRHAYKKLFDSVKTNTMKCFRY